MWKVKQSKYKNAFPKLPKKEEWIVDVSANALLHSCGNHIKASDHHIVFITDISGGSSLVVLPLTSSGRQNPADYKYINAHSDFVTDFDFSPCSSSLLATCSLDCTAKVFRLPETVEENISNREQTLQGFSKRVENVLWHPCSEDVLAVTSENCVKIFDVSTGSEKCAIDRHGDQVQSMSWSPEGKQLVTSCRDTKVRILDPRAQTVVQEAAGPAGNKDSRAVWCTEHYVLTSGFDMTRERVVGLHDARMALGEVATQRCGVASGVLMPLFDADTNMLFLAGQGDTTLRYLEVSDKTPYLNISRVDTVEQVKGLALAPKLAPLDVMSGEVNRLLLLTKDAIIPIPYIVPRKSYLDFHADLFPDTPVRQSALSAAQWCAGRDAQRSTVSLDPSKKKGAVPEATTKAQSGSTSQNKETKVNPEVPLSPAKLSTDGAAGSVAHEPNINVAQAIQAQHKPKVLAGVRQSKFKHLEGSTTHQSQHISNIRNVSVSIPGQSDMFAANPLFCAVPLAGAGGLIAILRTEKQVRLPDAAMPSVQNGSNVMDFAFDPFDHQRLAVGCEDGTIRIWKLPNSAIEGTLTEPSMHLRGHTERVYTVGFHPLASDLLVTSSQDLTVRLWDLRTGDDVITLQGHTDAIFSVAWNPAGDECATLCKDGQLRIYRPRATHLPIKIGKGPDGTRGGRVVYACGGKYIAVTGSDSRSTRCVRVYSAAEPEAPLFSVELDCAPAVLVPYYDQDTNTLFLTARGETIVRTFEVSEEYPHLFELSSVSFSSPHQSLAFLSKNAVDVRSVEFARALRLTASTIEPVSFTLPRVKTEYFQDDVFVRTRVTWRAALTGAQWLSGEDRGAETFSLRPADMPLLSEAQPEAPKPRKYEDFSKYQKTYKTDEEKREELVSAMSAKLGVQGEPLPQADAEGVDSDEWEDSN